MVVEYSRKNSSAADIEAEVECLDDFEPVALAEVRTEPMAPRNWGHSTVGQWARIENMTILGEDVHVCDEIYSNGGVVPPHKEFKASILKLEVVM